MSAAAESARRRRELKDEAEERHAEAVPEEETTTEEREPDAAEQTVPVERDDLQTLGEPEQVMGQPVTDEEARTMDPAQVEQPLPVHVLMGQVMAGVQPIGKDQQNREQGYSFRGIDQVMRELHPLLSARGVLMLPTVLERVAETRTTRAGSAMYAVHLHVLYRFMGPLGDELVVDAWGEGADTADKATPKAMTAALKAALLQTFLIPTPDTVDADATTPEPTYSASQVERAEAAAKATRECTDLRKLVNIGAHAHQQNLLDCPIRTEQGTEPLRALLDRTRARLEQDASAEQGQGQQPAEAPQEPRGGATPPQEPERPSDDGLQGELVNPDQGPQR